MIQRFFGIIIFTLLTAFSLTAQVPKNISLVSSYTFSGQSLAGCWHYEDSLGHAYGLVGTANGIAILSLDTPSNPGLLFQIPGVNSTWHEVKVAGKFAYAVSEGTDPNGIKNGLQIINLSYLPDSAPYVFYQGNGTILNQLTRAHSVTTAGHYVYINGHNISSLGSGVLICDIADPMHPVYTGAITQNYCHDCYVRGDTIWTSDIGAGQFSVYNISDRSNPVLLASQQTPTQANHNAWLSDDGRTLFTTDERNNAPLASFDVSDLSNITLLDEYETIHTPASEVHNVRVINDYLVNADYGSQLTIADASHPDNIVETGNYPTGTFLCWDADPYLSSGLILATDMNSNTFYVFKPSYTRACYLEGTVTDSVTGVPINGASVQIVSATVIKTTNTIGNYKTGIADPGTYSINFFKTGYFPRIISGVSLSTGLTTILNVKLLPDHTGISDEGPGRRISVFPNPASCRFVVETDQANLKSVRLYDPAGQAERIYQMKDPGSRKAELSLDGISPGSYLLEITTDQGVSIRKIVRN